MRVCAITFSEVTMKKRIFIVVLSLLLTLSLILSSCGDDEESSTGSNSDTYSETQTNTQTQTQTDSTPASESTKPVEKQKYSISFDNSGISEVASSVEMKLELVESSGTPKAVEFGSFDEGSIFNVQIKNNSGQRVLVNLNQSGSTVDYIVVDANGTASFDATELLGNVSLVLEYPEIVKIPLDYDKTYMGNSLKNLSKMFDEQNLDAIDTNYTFPATGVSIQDFDNDGNINDFDRNSQYVITADMSVKKYVSAVYLYFATPNHDYKIEVGTPFNYEREISGTATSTGWLKIDVGYDTQYVNFTFYNGQTPLEVMVYGYDLGFKEEIATTVHERHTMGYLLGVNGHVQSNRASDISAFGYYRDYKTWTFAYRRDLYESGGTSFSGSYYDNMKAKYKTLNSNNVDPVPCFMWDGNSLPMFDGADKTDPASYVMYSEFLFQYALRFGTNPNASVDDVVAIKNGKAAVSYGYVHWIELGNEPNGEDAKGWAPYSLAALTSAAYDGHMNTLTSASGSKLGIKNADPNMKVAMAGLAGWQERYIKAMAFWLKYNRTDGNLGVDAFNSHTYCRHQIKYNGTFIEVGVSPEAYDLAGALRGVCEFRDKYYPDVEVWITEFGWDTNQSYATQGSCHAYGPFTGRQVQAMWLTRTYFILSEIGVDRGAMYMLFDVGPEETSVGKYGTSGVITSDGTKKDSWYYLSTLKAHMYDMYFEEVIDSGNEDVWIYKYDNHEGKTCYAVWCPTTDDVRVNDFKLNVGNAKTVTLVEMADKEPEGISTPLTVNNQTVSVNVSECPILVICE